MVSGLRSGGEHTYQGPCSPSGIWARHHCIKTTPGSGVMKFYMSGSALASVMGIPVSVVVLSHVARYQALRALFRQRCVDVLCVRFCFDV